MHLGKVSLGLAAALLVSSNAMAATVTDGFTFSVADGAHFHSSTGGSFGNPAGKAEVGSYSGEDCRGLSEYDLAGLGVAPQAFVTFNVFDNDGLFNQGSFTGDINIVAYQGDNAEDVSDFSAASVGSVGTFSTAGLSVGQVLSFDITAIFNNAIANAWSSLGIRLEAVDGGRAGGAWTFDTFRLTSDDQTTGGPTQPNPNVIPTPAAAGAGLVMLAAGAFRRRRGA